MTPAAAHALSLLESARARAKDATLARDWQQAAQWAERAWRLADRRLLSTLELAAVLAQTGDRRATPLLLQAARHCPAFPVLFALVSSLRREGAHGAAQAALHRLLQTAALDALQPGAKLAGEIAHRAGLAGWIGWRDGRVLFGSADTAPDALGFTLDGRAIALDWTPDAPQVWSAALPKRAGSVRATAPVLGAPLRPRMFRTPTGAASRTVAGVQGWVMFPHDPGRQPAVAITVLERGCRTERPVPTLTLASATQTEPFARRWLFDWPLDAGATVLRVTEAGSGDPIALDTPALEAKPGRSAAPGPRAGQPDRPCVLLVTHDEGGGTERFVQQRRQALRRAGQVGVVLRSCRGEPGAARLGETAIDPPDRQQALLRRLDELRPARLEFHQLRRHSPAVWQLAATLGVPYDVYLHDYTLLCPRGTLVGDKGQYCGEPPVARCERCVSGFDDRHLFAPDGVQALRRRSTALIRGAARVIAPSADIAARFRRHMPDVTITLRPWETSTGRRLPPPACQDQARVCVVGALNHHKGFDILLECARDAAVRRLPIRFIVVGHTSDDDALLGAGAFVTGPYADEERADLIARQQTTVGFLPSIWPEPWCYALTGLLEAGLPTLCFEIGAQAQRVRAAGGRTLALGASAQQVNEQLLALHRRTVQLVRVGQST